MDNYMKLEIAALGENEGFARSAVAAFALCLNPSLSELSDIKTAVSEAVTNCVVHAYKKANDGKILIECLAKQDENVAKLHIKITDFGCGIEDTEKVVAPFYTSLPDEERSGMGFTIMQAFMDEFVLKSEKDKGTTVQMLKKIGMEFATESQGEKERIHA